MYRSSAAAAPLHSPSSARRWDVDSDGRLADDATESSRRARGGGGSAKRLDQVRAPAQRIHANPERKRGFPRLFRRDREDSLALGPARASAAWRCLGLLLAWCRRRSRSSHVPVTFRSRSGMVQTVVLSVRHQSWADHGPITVRSRTAALAPSESSRLRALALASRLEHALPTGPTPFHAVSNEYTWM